MFFLPVSRKTAISGPHGEAPQFIVDTCARWLDSMDHFGSIATILWNRLALRRAGGYPWAAMPDDETYALRVR